VISAEFPGHFYQQKASPLFRLLKKEAEWKWGDIKAKAFNELKQVLLKDMTLVHPNFTQPFVITTDASTLGLGAYLSQVIDGPERPITVFSRTLSKAEKNYHITELACLAVDWAIKEFRPYVLLTKFEEVSDHSALQFAQSHWRTHQYMRQPTRLHT
jgi:hypothetical protein